MDAFFSEQGGNLPRLETDIAAQRGPLLWHVRRRLEMTLLALGTLSHNTVALHIGVDFSQRLQRPAAKSK